MHGFHHDRNFKNARLLQMVYLLILGRVSIASFPVPRPSQAIYSAPGGTPMVSSSSDPAIVPAAWAPWATRLSVFPGAFHPD